MTSLTFTIPRTYFVPMSEAASTFIKAFFNVKLKNSDSLSQVEKLVCQTHDG